ncbi:autotransporter outer membrane beta-barrel domain-containing protein, partial [Helicobacter sp. 12S02232-10]|uniref:autotransporter outer membrane beta-barrel domain-containing protein n=1 Tax=Helicobacter sp. 12S02232-10 TaxID=1476197 RepID=UPI00117A4654
IQTTKGTTNIAFSSTPSSINFDNTKLQNLITTLTPKKDETSQPISKEATPSSTPSAPSSSSETITPEIQKALIANPLILQNYLQASGVSSYAGDIITGQNDPKNKETFNGANNVDFKDSLYLGGTLDTTGAGTANVTLSFSKEFVDKLKNDALLQSFLYAGKGPEFNVITDGASATNNIALAGSIKGVASVHYLQGNTNIIFADKIQTPTAPLNKEATDATSTTSAFKGGDTTKFNDSTSFDIASSDTSKNSVKVNGYTYEQGLLIRLDAKKADALLKDYRQINTFKSNATTFAIDKISNPNVYTASISGVMVGEVDSLNNATPAVASKSIDTTPAYQAIFEKDAAFIGKLNIKDRDVSIALSRGSKLLLEDGSLISVLSSNQKDAPVFDTSHLVNETLLQDNTVIDLASTGGKVDFSTPKATYSTLTINQVKDLNDAVFRVAYNPQAKAEDANNKKADHFIINGVSVSTPKIEGSTPSVAPKATAAIAGAAAVDTSTSSVASGAVLNNYLQVYQNAATPVLGDLSDKKILVASIQNDSSGKAHLQFNTTSSVLQGYDLITTEFQTKVEDSANSTGTPKTASKEGGSTSPTFTNYYIAAASSQIDKKSEDMTAGAITTNYSIFLANINDLNKRLGELRGNLSAQGVWARIFNGMTTSNRGEEVKTYGTNVQGGYDFSIPQTQARSYFGVALSYGYNSLKAQDFQGKANLFEIGAYYSFVSDAGFYSDTILKYAFISNQLTLDHNEKENTTLNSSTISLGEEFGYRWNFLIQEKGTSKHSLYLEPNAEFILGYVGNGAFDQVNGDAFLNAAIDNILAFRGRVGANLGYSLKTAANQTDFRVGLSYVGDILGGGKMDFKTNFSSAQKNLQSNQMALVSLGVNSILNANWRVYADVDTSFGGQYYNQNYLVSVGGRYAFGKQIASAPKASKLKKVAPKVLASLAKGFYLEVLTLPRNAKLSDSQLELLNQYPYAIALEVIPLGQPPKDVEVQKILIGPFKTSQGAQNNQNTADEIAKILNQKETKALIREVK